MKPISIILISLFLSVQIVSGQSLTEVTDQIIRNALTQEHAYNNLKDLCAIGPRLTGSTGSLRAIKWAESLLANAGFDSVWLQPVTVPHWERGNIESLEIITPGKHLGKRLSITALGRSVGTPKSGLTASVIRVDSLAALKHTSVSAKDKIVFYDGQFDTGLPGTFSAYGKIVKQRTRGAIEAASLGAVASISRSTTSLHDDTPHTGVMSYADSITKIPGVAISMLSADYLAQALKDQPDLQVRMQLSCVNFDSAKSYNVIGEIKGTEYPDEIIVVAGHFDSWDKGDGAHDNGGGCMQAFEVLDLFRRLGLHPKRTIRCVFFMDEEQRQTGSRTYAAVSDSLHEKHIAAIESDRGVFSPRGFSVKADSAVITKMQSWLPLLEPAGINWIRAGGSGADISRIKNADALIGLVVNDERYFDYHHSANDTFEKVHPREMAMGSAAMAVLVYLISEQGFE